MSITRDKLSIILITYNRARFLEATLQQILSDCSPIRECCITVLDNHSTDATEGVIKRFAAKHHNLHHIVNRFNVGGNANIAKALERYSTPYHWVICDDDVYDWSGWTEVEAAILRGEQLICVGDRHLPRDPAVRSRPENLIQQMTFLPSIIYGPGVINETSIRNAYDNTFALFPHLAPVIMHLNEGGRIFPISHGIVTPGEYGADISYNRGYDKSKIFPIGRTMVLSAGFAYLTAAINNRRLSKKTFGALVFGSQMGRVGFYGEVFARLRGRDGAANFQAILRQSSFLTRINLHILRFIQNSFLYHLVTNRKLYKFVQGIADKSNELSRLKLKR